MTNYALLASAAESFVLKGDIVYCKGPQELVSVEGGYLVCVEGRSQGVFEQLPERYSGLPLRDWSGKLVIPGLIDLHTHAPQFAFRGIGMDLELLDWLQTYTFPEEARYRDLAYAREAYEAFVRELVHGATTRAVVFATVHVPATMLLMELLEASGLITMVGKVNMDRNAPDNLSELDAKSSLAATRAWLDEACRREFKRTLPILTPRFVPSCSDELLAGLADAQRQYELPVQSHLSENPAEIRWVAELRPDARCYADAYLRSGLLGGAGCPTIMAHCVYTDPDEAALLKQREVYVAHCPTSNTCLASGIAPVREFLVAGMRVGLGTDVAGGYSPSMLHAVAEAVKVSKLRWRLVDQCAPPLTVTEAFYLATRGGGSFWGEVGSFEPGFEFDAVVLNDDDLPQACADTLASRLERLIYLDAGSRVLEKYVAGTRIGL
ncbi:MAG: amidohydrolase family protein [Coriobacteriales bacterium]|jgi:guanine deaminase|nr:amidohydrolase family protein [Coriobacteriales bacterium]